jgi:hypothetical protein
MHSEFPDAAEFRRRYTAVALSDDRVSTLTALRSLAGGRIGDAERLPGAGSGGASLFRVELLDSVYRYSTIDNPDPLGNRQRHLGYAAFFQGSQSPITLLVSPFARLLGRVTADVSAAADPPLKGYLRYDVGKMMSLIRQHDVFPVEDVAAVSLRVQGDEAVDLVRLTGSAPLVSTLLASVEGMRFDRPGGGSIELVTPYGLVLRIHEGLGAPVRLSIDRHGNLHWYQLSEPAVGSVVGILRALDSLETVVSIDPRDPTKQSKASAPT